MSDKKLLTIKLFGILKEFVSQKSDRVINPEVPWLLSVSTLDEFKKLLWCNAQPYLKREIYFTNDRPHWSDKMFPEEEDLNRFLIFFDTKARRTAYLDSITMADLERWSDGRALTVNIAEYSTAVNSKASFKLVEKYLFSDRKVLSPEEEPVIEYTYSVDGKTNVKSSSEIASLRESFNKIKELAFELNTAIEIFEAKLCSLEGSPKNPLS